MAKIKRDDILAAADTWHKYKDGKRLLEERITENETWFRMHHWRYMRDGKRTQTGWTFAAIINKHADFMDNKPEVSVLPREKSDEDTAQKLTEILPVILKRAGWEESYDLAIYDKLKKGAEIYAVLWDPKAENGLGGVRIPRIDAINLYWEPGVRELEQSKYIFLTEMIDHEELIDAYPNIKDLKTRLSAPAEDVPKYLYQENVDTSGKSVVINWYYKRRGVLHYCRFVQDIILFASENEPGYENGWYADGHYPFVMEPLFPEPESPHGFGIIDVARDTQEDIDQLNELVMKNAKIAARRRFFVRQDAEINEEEYANFDGDFVHFSGNLSDQSLKEIGSDNLSGTYVAIQENKIAELKENTFNRDVNSGGAGNSGQTAAGIAALQESGSKSSRAAIQTSYRAFERVVELVIERLRQFYTVPRVFRIVGDDKAVRFEEFSNAGLVDIPIDGGIEEDFGTKEPVFDLDIKVSKSNAWSRQAQNQDVMNFYGMGFFDPRQSTQALACLEVLDIDNKDKLIETIKKNGLKEQFIAQFLPLLIQACADPNMAMAAMQAARAAGLIEAPEMGAPVQNRPGMAAETDVNGGIKRANNYMDRQRAVAMDRTAPRA